MFSPLLRTHHPVLRAVVATAPVDSNVLRIAVARPRYSSSSSSSSSSTKPALCPACSAQLPTPLPACPSCRQHILRAPSDMNKHAIFSIPDAPNPFVVDTAALKHRFREIQRVVHPDAWSGNEKQDIARQLSALVNGSYKTLLSPMKRVEYILERHGLPLSETDQLEDPAFMMEIMESREELEEASGQEDVNALIAANQEKIKETLQVIEKSVGEQDWPTVKTAAIRLKYLEGIDAAGHAWPESVSDH